MLFCHDNKDKMRILAKKPRKNKLKKSIADFSKPKEIFIFTRPFWFTYRGPDKLEKVAKWKLLDSKRHAKYDSDNKDHVFAAIFFVLH